MDNGHNMEIKVAIVESYAVFDSLTAYASNTTFRIMIRQNVERFSENETVQHRWRGHSGKIVNPMTSAKINMMSTNITQNPKQLKMKLSKYHDLLKS